MFKFLKRKNKIKELECRVSTLETKITHLNSRIINSISIPSINFKEDDDLGNIYLNCGTINRDNIQLTHENTNKKPILPLFKDTELSKNERIKSY